MNKLLAKLTLWWYKYCPKHFIDRVYGCSYCRAERRKAQHAKDNAARETRYNRIQKAIAVLGGNVTNV